MESLVPAWMQVEYAIAFREADVHKVVHEFHIVAKLLLSLVHI